MKIESYRELQVLEGVSAKDNVSQRQLARDLGVALGLTNLLLRRLVNKGYVKVVNLQRNRIRYLLTPQGIAEKTRLTYEFLEYSLYLYRKVRKVLEENLQQLAAEGARAIVLYGTGEIAEIAYLVIRAVGLELVGVVDDDRAGGTFLGYPVLKVADLATLNFDFIVVGALEEGLQYQEKLKETGISQDRIVVMVRRGPAIRILPRLGGL